METRNTAGHSVKKVLTSREFCEVANGNKKPVRVKTGLLPKKKKVDSIYCELLKNFKGCLKN
jgi:hypothetical protein